MKSTAVDAYIAGFPKPVQALLRQVRRTIRAAAPQAEEVISYRMPAYKLHGMIVYFAGFNAIQDGAIGGDAVLVKGSNSVGLAKLVTHFAR